MVAPTNHVVPLAGFTLRGASGTVPFYKFGPGYCIAFIERLDEGLR